ncbi:hypothetical protein [Umezawaea sp.]|uniref:hypothetical protein n=1 Tax=Umezawaea sp. TaxID=1955258 RepID=UPI002ED63D4C
MPRGPEPAPAPGTVGADDTTGPPAGRVDGGAPPGPPGMVGLCETCPPACFGPDAMAFDPPGTGLKLLFGSIFRNADALFVSVETVTCWVAFNPCWTSPNAFEPRSACATALSLELFSAGTANRPIGPSAPMPRLSPRRPLEMELSRDCMSPARLWRPLIVDSLWEKPEFPVGPDPIPAGGGGGAGFVVTDGVAFGLTLGLPELTAMTGSLQVVR